MLFPGAWWDSLRRLLSLSVLLAVAVLGMRNGHLSEETCARIPSFLSPLRAWPRAYVHTVVGITKGPAGDPTCNQCSLRPPEGTPEASVADL